MHAWTNELSKEREREERTSLAEKWNPRWLTIMWSHTSDFLPSSLMRIKRQEDKDQFHSDIRWWNNYPEDKYRPANRQTPLLFSSARILGDRRFVIRRQIMFELIKHLSVRVLDFCDVKGKRLSSSWRIIIKRQKTRINIDRETKSHS